MKNLTFKELNLISFVECSAFKIKFNPNLTIIHSGDINKTGKSSIIKSIYNTLGADVSFHRTWKALDIISILTFLLDGTQFTMLKNKGKYTLFNSENNIIGQWSKVTTELAPYFADLLNYKFTLKDRSNNEVTTPPAYFFLPFYIDQDKSWVSDWSSFENLGQFSDWKDIVTKYHLGILTDEYFELSKKIAETKKKIDKLNKDSQSLTFTLDKYKNDLKDLANFNMDINSFQQNIETIQKEITNLQQVENELKYALNELYNEKHILNQQKMALNKALKGIEINFNKLNINSHCKYCGHTHKNDFESRLKTAEDEAQIYQLLQENNEELFSIEEKITKKNKEYQSKAYKMKELQDLFTQTNSHLTLSELITLEGKRQFKEKIEEDLASTLNDFKTNEALLKNYQKRKKDITNQKRKNEIMTNYKEKMKYFIGELEVENIHEDDYKDLRTKINEQGSDQPRALLAYYMSVLHIIKANSTSTFCPIVIDSPNQQDQSKGSLKKMLEVIINDKPKGSQLVLAVVEDPKINIADDNYSKVEITEKHNLLKKDQFEIVLNNIKDLLDKALNYSL